MKQVYTASIAGLAIASIVGLALAPSVFAVESSTKDLSSLSSSLLNDLRSQVQDESAKRRAEIINQYGSEIQKAKDSATRATEQAGQLQREIDLKSHVNVGGTSGIDAKVNKQQLEARLAEAKKKAEDAKKQAEAKAASVKQKLEPKQKEICEQQEAQIKQVTARIASRSQSLLDKLSAITANAEDYYQTQGKDLANYDEIMTVVETSKEAAQKAVDSIKSAGTFNCDGDAPRMAIQDFRANGMVASTELKAYRDSVKDLLGGVKAAQTGQGLSANGTFQIGNVKIGGSSSVGGSN